MARSDRHRRETGVLRAAKATGAAVGTVLVGVQTTRERLNAFLLPIAWWTGVAGLVALALSGALWLLPAERWPAALDPDHLPVYLTVSLVLASLLGWGCMLQGLARVRRAVGWRVGGWLFVLLPLGCAVAGALDVHGVIALDDLPGAPWAARALRWYPPLVVSLALVVYVALKARPRDEGRFERAAWFTAVVAPYALLIATIALGVEASWLEGPVADTVDELGSWAIVLQVVLAYFVGGGGATP